MFTKQVSYVIVRIQEFAAFAGCGVCLAKALWFGAGLLAIAGIVLWVVRAIMERDLDAK